MQSEKIGKIDQIDGAFKGCQSVEIYTYNMTYMYVLEISTDLLCFTVVSSVMVVGVYAIGTTDKVLTQSSSRRCHQAVSGAGQRHGS